MRRLAAAALVAVAVAATVTGPATAGSAGAASGRGSEAVTDPCKLLTRAEVAAAWDQPAGRPQRLLGPTFCQWDLAATAERAAGQVNTLLERGSAARRDFRLARRLGDTGASTVAGLGRKAFFAPDTGTLFVLADRRTLFYVQANVFAPDATRITEGTLDTLVALATRAEARV